jgi:hypothetical protein
MSEEGLEVFVLLTLRVVLQDGPPRAGRIMVRWTAQMAFIEPNSLVNQSVRGPALVWKMLPKRANEARVEWLWVGLFA